MSLKDSPLNKLVYGDGNEIKLPSTRKQAFVFYGKEHFGKLILTSLICFAFFIPAIIWLYVMNYARAEALAALDATAETYLQQYSSLLVAHALKTYLVLIPFIAVGFVGLAGGFTIVKKIIFNERSNYSVFWKGIAGNWFFFAVWGIVFGISYFLLRFDTTYYTVGALHPAVKGIFIGVGVLQFVFVAMMTPFFCTGCVVYKYKLGQALKNAALLTFSRLFVNFAVVTVCFAPLVAVAFIPSPFQLIGLAVIAVFYCGYTLLAFSCYCNHLFDVYINPKLGGEYVGKGLRRKDCSDAQPAKENVENDVTSGEDN